MSDIKDFDAKINSLSISNIINEIYRISNNNTNTSNVKVCDDKNLGTVYYTIIGNEIKISFIDKQKEYYILKNIVYFINEKDKENNFYSFQKDGLERTLNKYSSKYYFIVNNKIIDKDEILKSIPKEVILRKKDPEELNKEVFICINNKKDLSTENSIEIQTNELIPQNMRTLGIYRDKAITLVIKKRYELINEIKDFANDKNEEIMKIYGVDGIGKSLTFIYLTSLTNDFKIIYFNLKEFHKKKYSQIINLFKSQIANLYTSKIDSTANQEDKKLINEDAFSLYLKSMKYLDENINYKDDINFWYLLNIFLNMISKKYDKNILVIIDQYKIENDPENELKKLENNIIENIGYIKLIIVSSLNDLRVKNDFIDHLETYLENPKKDIKRLETKIQVSNSDEHIENIIKNFSDVDEISQKEDDDFEKIKIFGENKDNEKDKIKNNNDIPEDTYIKKIDKSSDSNQDINDKINDMKKYRIVYINDLVSAKYIKEEDKELQRKLKEFNYNPKYYIKLKNYLEQNEVDNKSQNEIFDNFFYQTYENIREKILEFYENFNKRFKIELKNRDIGLMLIQLKKIVEEKIELDLKSLIHYLYKFPIKYLKIIPIDNIKNNNIIRINKRISNSQFRLEYIFPFFKIIINRLIFDYGNNRDIQCSDLPPSGIGNFLESLIRKSILDRKIYGEFHSRNVWTFERINQKKSKKQQQKGRKKK